MHICPIVIEPHGIVVSTLGQLNELQSNAPILYRYVIASGDAKRLYESFALDVDNFEDAIEIMNLNDNEGSQLIGCRYTTKNLSGLYVGYHRQKSVIEIKGDMTLSGDLQLSFCTIFGSGTLTVPSGLKATFHGVIFDGITLHLSPGSHVALNSIEFSDCGEFGLKIDSGAKIIQFESVSFMDCHKEIFIERADREHLGCVIDFDSATEIIHALERNIIHEIVLDRDFHPSHHLMELRQSVKFINGAQQHLAFRVPRIIPEKDFILEGVFNCEAEVQIQETSDQEISLSIFAGNLLLDDAKNIVICNSIFGNWTKQLHMIDSEATFKDCEINKGVEFVSSGTSLSFENAKFKSCLKPIKFKEYRPKENEFRISEPLPNSVSFSKVHFKDCTELLGSETPLSLVFNQCNSEHSTDLINANNCNIIVKNMRAVSSERVYRLNRCTLREDHGTYEECNMPFDAGDRSDVEMKSTEIKNADAAGVHMHESKLTLIEVQFIGCKNGIVAEQGEGLILHRDCTFVGTRERNILQGYGNRVLNLKEEGQLAAETV